MLPQAQFQRELNCHLWRTVANENKVSHLQWRHNWHMQTLQAVLQELLH